MFPDIGIVPLFALALSVESSEFIAHTQSIIQLQPHAIQQYKLHTLENVMECKRIAFFSPASQILFVFLS